ncbi:hypothetical protein XM38_050830 [Halomicronema hongdechloris C2206]|uniref:Polymerase beta nucleotidyltransferase domain-containing protein n=1 Tax=Halomicronema hongdechloris C2206 TaxID=1641165 RepID=A0A1Z3HUW4_9CYAN|nr:hypothetical protein XM38_050830 [Halomicronema hongdechloris C2206]
MDERCTCILDPMMRRVSVFPRHCLPYNASGRNGSACLTDGITVKAIRPENMATYRQTLRLREAEAQQQRQQRWQAAWGVARQGGDILKQEFRAIQVIVFGSLLHPEWFSMTSDIDLAVAGLSAWDHLAAIAQMQDLSDFKVDVIRLETCPPRLRGVIEAEGQEL